MRFDRATKHVDQKVALSLCKCNTWDKEKWLKLLFSFMVTRGSFSAVKIRGFQCVQEKKNFKLFSGYSFVKGGATLESSFIV